MDISSSIEFALVYLKYLLPLSFVMNVTIKLLSIFENAFFKGRVKVD